MSRGSTGQAAGVPDDDAPSGTGPRRPDGRLAQAYRRAAERGAATSPLHARVATAISGSDDVLRALGTAPAQRRQPARVLAALHDLALSGGAPALADAYGAADPDAAAQAAVATLRHAPDAVLRRAARRPVAAPDPQRCAPLLPAVAEAGRRTGARSVGLIGVDGSAGLDLHVDRVGITYGGGPALGDPASLVLLTAQVVGERAVPSRPVPEVVARLAVGPDPVDVVDPADVRWLRACLPPDQPAPAARLAAHWRWPRSLHRCCCAATSPTCSGTPWTACPRVPCRW